MRISILWVPAVLALACCASSGPGLVCLEDATGAVLTAAPGRIGADGSAIPETPLPRFGIVAASAAADPACAAAIAAAGGLPAR